MKAGLSLNVFLQGTSKPLLCVDLCSFMFKDTQGCTLHLFDLKHFLDIQLLLNKLFIPSNSCVVLNWSNPKLISADLCYNH